MRNRLHALLAPALLALAALSHAAGEVLLAREAPAGLDPAPYWVSEKLDGVRAIWDGTVLRSRGGVRIDAPRWFVEALPRVALDGELWLGRGRFDEVSALARRSPPRDEEWRAVRYLIFELPGADGDFSARVERIRGIVARAGLAWLQAVPQRRLANRRELERWLQATLAAGGEGLMLHRADSRYHGGRSDALLKLKPWLDGEARVVAHLPGTGRNRGRLGALLVERADGLRFRLGSGFTDAERSAPPAVGAIVSYRYRSLTPAGVPRFASFWRVRADAALQAMPGSSGAGASSASR